MYSVLKFWFSFSVSRQFLHCRSSSSKESIILESFESSVQMSSSVSSLISSLTSANDLVFFKLVKKSRILNWIWSFVTREPYFATRDNSNRKIAMMQSITSRVSLLFK